MDQLPKLKVRPLTKDATIPSKGSKMAAGYDIHSAENKIIPPKKRALVKTDLEVQVPPGTYGRLAPKSSLTIKYDLDIGAGVVDEDFTGNLNVALINNGVNELAISKGMKIAQLICEKIEQPTLEIVEQHSILRTTERGSRGFGTLLK